MSLSAAACGARPVLNLEPQAPLKETFHQLVQILGYEDVVFRVGTIQSFAPADQRYDVILSYNSINHLDEEACSRLASNPDAQQRYLELFDKLTRTARPGPRLIIADCSNRSVFSDLGWPNAFAPMIEWKNHQRPELCASSLGRIGWLNPRIRWTSPNTLGGLGRVLMGNRVVSYLTVSHFCLVMQKLR